MIFGFCEWEVIPGREAAAAESIRDLEAIYFADTRRRPLVLTEDHLAGALGYINPLNARIELYSGERYGPAARAEELLHYKQLKDRGLLGKTEAEIGIRVIAELEIEVETLLRQAGFRPRRS